MREVATELERRVKTDNLEMINAKQITSRMAQWDLRKSFVKLLSCTSLPKFKVILPF